MRDTLPRLQKEWYTIEGERCSCTVDITGYPARWIKYQRLYKDYKRKGISQRVKRTVQV